MLSICFECGAQAEHHHHVVPRSRGGTRTVPLCAHCHGLAHATSMAGRSLTRQALAAKKAKGERTGSVPTGFALAADGRSLVPDPHETEAVELARTLRAQGLTYRAIGALLEARGYRPRGGRWHPTTIMRALAGGQAS